jgi:hypothetical protein
VTSQDPWWFLGSLGGTGWAPGDPWAGLWGAQGSLRETSEVRLELLGRLRRTLGDSWGSWGGDSREAVAEPPRRPTLCETFEGVARVPQAFCIWVSAPFWSEVGIRMFRRVVACVLALLFQLVFRVGGRLVGWLVGAWACLGVS